MDKDTKYFIIFLLVFVIVLIVVIENYIGISSIFFNLSEGEEPLNLSNTITGRAINVPETYEDLEDDLFPSYFLDDDGKYLITYRVDDDCFNMTKKLIDKSFENINEAVDGRFDFKKVESGENIIFNCFAEKYDKSGNYHYCDDNYCYTQPVEQTLGLSEGDLIDFKNVGVDLYSGGFDLVAIEHETLHSLGIRGHRALGSSVMSPYSDPDEDQYIDEKTINKLKELYP